MTEKNGFKGFACPPFNWLNALHIQPTPDPLGYMVYTLTTLTARVT